MVKDSAHRVPRNTMAQVNEEIRRTTRQNIARYKCGDPALIAQRLHELDQEWDIERVLETNAAGLSLAGLVLSRGKGRGGWLLLTAAVGIFLLQHGVQGWCPPVNVLRRLGFRTRKEIDEERYALKVLRGDFQNLPVEQERERFNMDLLYSALKRE